MEAPDALPFPLRTPGIMGPPTNLGTSVFLANSLSLQLGSRQWNYGDYMPWARGPYFWRDTAEVDPC